MKLDGTDSMEAATAALVSALVNGLGWDEDDLWTDITNLLSAIPSDAEFEPGPTAWHAFDNAAPDGGDGYVFFVFVEDTLVIQAARASEEQVTNFELGRSETFFDRLEKESWCTLLGARLVVPKAVFRRWGPV